MSVGYEVTRLGKKHYKVIAKSQDVIVGSGEFKTKTKDQAVTMMREALFHD